MADKQKRYKEEKCKHQPFKFYKSGIEFERCRKCGVLIHCPACLSTPCSCSDNI